MTNLELFFALLGVSGLIVSVVALVINLNRRR